MGKRGHSEEEILRVLREGGVWKHGGGDLPQNMASASSHSICGRRSMLAWG